MADKIKHYDFQPEACDYDCFVFNADDLESAIRQYPDQSNKPSVFLCMCWDASKNDGERSFFIENANKWEQISIYAFVRHEALIEAHTGIVILFAPKTFEWNSTQANFIKSRLYCYVKSLHQYKALNRDLPNIDDLNPEDNEDLVDAERFVTAATDKLKDIFADFQI